MPTNLQTFSLYYDEALKLICQGKKQKNIFFNSFLYNEIEIFIKKIATKTLYNHSFLL
jgi:hypothetical protein